MQRADQARRPYSVSELAQEIRRALRPLNTVLVKGEVSGMRQTSGGHYNLTIKDAGAVLEGFIFAGDARKMPILPEDGQEFVLRGRVDFWTQAGRLRLIIDYVEFDDVGRMRAQLELVKRRLEAEGAFEPGRKRPLPFLPRRVALITSPTGAVIHDLQQTIWDRYPNMEVVVYAAQVQGAAAPGSVVAALRRCNQEAIADVVVIARGGGSFEELYGFNTEPVARAILASRVPVVTALGHTSDRTLADMVADAECRTPTEAGARVVPRKSELLAQLGERARRLERESRTRLRVIAEQLQARQQRLAQALPRLVRARSERLARIVAELARLSPIAQVARRQDQLHERARRLGLVAAGAVQSRILDLDGRRAGPRLERALAERFAAASQALEHRTRRLAALSPDGVLARGYSITQDEESGLVLRAASETAPGRRLHVRLATGTLAARVERA